MTIPFIPVNSSAVIAYADDSTDTAVTFDPTSGSNPNCLYVVNPDTANVVVVNYSFTANDTNAVVPTSGADGLGVVVGAGSSVLIRIDSTYQGGPLYVSGAGVSATGNIFVTPGVL
jgi:hypothetical protein